MPSADKWHLPDDVRPASYRLTLTPDLDSFTFKGSETVSIEVSRPTASVTLNSVEIEIHSASVSQSDRSGMEAVEVTFDTDAETATLTFAEVALSRFSRAKH